MKANELMIGDWVMMDMNYSEDDPMYSRPDYQPYQIRNGEDIDLAEEKNCIGDTDVYQPIPLTDDILRNNGFEFTEADKLTNKRCFMCHLSRMNGEYKYMKTRNKCLIDCAIVGYSDLHKEWQIVQMFGKNMSIDAGNVNSVHELQQAMRLCGIDKEITIKQE